MNPAPNLAPLLILIVSAGVAISGSNRKWRTLLVIFASMVAGFVLGLLLGLLLRNMAAGGDAAAFATLVMGSGAAIKEILSQRKARKTL